MDRLYTVVGWIVALTVLAVIVVLIWMYATHPWCEPDYHGVVDAARCP